MKKLFVCILLFSTILFVFTGCQHAVVELGNGEFSGVSIPQHSSSSLHAASSTTATTATTTTVKPTTTSTTVSTTKTPTKVTQKTASQKEQNDANSIVDANMTPEEKEAIERLKFCPKCGHRKEKHHHHRYMSTTECPDCGVLVEARACHVCGGSLDECPTCNNNTTDATP